MVKVDKVMLGDQVTGPLGPVVVTPPTAGVRKLIPCPDPLPSAGKAAAGKYAEWKAEKDGRVTTVAQYTVLYQGVSGRDVVKESRAVSTCFGTVADGVGLQPFYQESLASTKRFVDDRFGFCEYPVGGDDYTCTAVLAKGEVVTVVAVHGPRDTDLSVDPDLKDFAPALTDRLFA
jgi:hypothetical protein